MIVGLAVTVMLVEPETAGSEVDVAVSVTVADCRLSGIEPGAV